MKKRIKKRLLLNFIIAFIGFFVLGGFTILITFSLLQAAVKLPEEHFIKIAAFVVLNHIIVSVIFGILGAYWKMLTVEKPVAEINEVLKKIKKGDSSSRLERRRYLSRYATIVNNINLMADELASIDTLKVSLMSNISHELKTPISVINNYATLLQQENLSYDKQIEYAKAISESSKKMTELITNILKLNQLENQNIPYDNKVFNLSEQLCECLLTFEEIWEEKDIEVDTHIEEDILVSSNMQLFSIVWNNLFSNAFKFTQKNGKVTVSLSQTAKHAVVEISDTGCGIPEDQQELIFEKFYQCDTSRATDGNGLGLALVKRIINITNSIIKVESYANKGTKFIIKIKKK